MIIVVLKLCSDEGKGQVQCLAAYELEDTGVPQDGGSDF